MTFSKLAFLIFCDSPHSWQFLKLSLRLRKYSLTSNFYSS